MSRVNYEMTKEDLEAILVASKSVPLMYLSGGQPMGPSQQENANTAWDALGKKMGFDYMTVQPIGRGDRFFSAECVETFDQAAARGYKEGKEMMVAEALMTARTKRDIHVSLGAALAAVEEAESELDFLILATPTGERRNALTETKIHIGLAKGKLTALPKENQHED